MTKRPIESTAESMTEQLGVTFRMALPSPLKVGSSGTAEGMTRPSSGSR